MPTYTKAEKAEATERLREWMPEGSTVYTILRHVSRGGTTRDIGLVVMTPHGPRHPNHSAAVVLGLSERRDSVRVGGWGMDMGFAIVDDLAKTLGVTLRHEWL